MGARQFLHSRPQYLDVPLTNDHHGHHHAKTSSIILAAKSRPLISPLQLPPREESTRVQLQHQLLREQQSTAVVPINGHLLPGLKTSAGMSSIPHPDANDVSGRCFLVVAALAACFAKRPESTWSFALLSLDGYGHDDVP